MDVAAFARGAKIFRPVQVAVAERPARQSAIVDDDRPGRVRLTELVEQIGEPERNREAEIGIRRPDLDPFRHRMARASPVGAAYRTPQFARRRA